MRDSLFFIRQSIANFRQTGALIPSGGSLARAMVDAIGPLQNDDVLIELGPGTGVFTRQLRDRFPDNRLLTVEFNEVLGQRLQDRMPDIDMIIGCASEIRKHLDELNIPIERVGAVVSGLPLLSLPRHLRDAILSGLTDVLSPGRRYVQFTYSTAVWKRWHIPGFRREPPRKVWLNVPPASVLPFTRTVEDGENTHV